MLMHLQMDNRQPRQRVGSIAMRRKRRVNMMTGIAFVAAVCFSSQLTMAFRLTIHTATRINVYDKRRNLVSALASIRESVSTSSATSKLSEQSHNHHHHQQQHQQHDHHISHHIHAFEPRNPIMKKIDVEIDSHHHNLQHHPHHQDLHWQNHDHAEPLKITPSPQTTTKPTKEKYASPAARTLEQPPSHILAIDNMNPIFQFKSKRTGNPKIINAHGLHHLVIILLTMPLWMIALEAVHALGTNIPGFDEDRGKFDRVGKIWCQVYLRLTNCYPIIDGDVGRLLDEMHKNNKNSRGGNNHSSSGGNGPCLFVANHASFLDIAVLCCVLNPTFKFIAKDSLKNFPGVGRQLVGGDHLLIDRTDKRSQLRMFKRAMKYLDDGISIMAFPEGARSMDGKLMDFKGGMFSLAIKSGVPIVPLSLSNTHAVYPSVGFLPVQDGKDKLRVYVHDPIDVNGKSESEISAEVRAALLSELPLDQHPLVE